MAKTKFEKELERELKKESRGHLVRMCEGKGLPHTGDKDVLVARLVAFEKAKDTEPEPKEPEVETPAADSEATPPSED